MKTSNEREFASSLLTGIGLHDGGNRGRGFPDRFCWNCRYGGALLVLPHGALLSGTDYANFSRLWLELWTHNC